MYRTLSHALLVAALTVAAAQIGCRPPANSTHADVVVQQLVADNQHFCALVQSGDVHCWGEKSEAGYFTFQHPGTTVVKVDLAKNHACALLSDGSIECWGEDDYGELGAPPSSDYVDFATGKTATCGIRSDGTLECWGDNGYGEADPPTSSHPFVQISGAQQHFCAANANNGAKCWGRDDDQQVSGKPSFDYASAEVGKTASCGLNTDGSLICWGSNFWGEPKTNRTDFVSLSVGENRGCGVTATGDAICWRKPALFSEPLDPEDSSNIRYRSVVGAGETFCGVRNNHRIHCVGDVGDDAKPRFCRNDNDCDASHFCSTRKTCVAGTPSALHTEFETARNDCGRASLPTTPYGEVAYGVCGEGCQGTVRATAGNDGTFHNFYEDCHPTKGESSPSMLLTPDGDLNPSIRNDGTIRFTWTESSKSASIELRVGEENSLQVVTPTEPGGRKAKVAGIPLDGRPIYAELTTTTGPYTHTENYVWEEGACELNRPASIDNHDDGDTFNTSEPTKLTWSGGVSGANYVVQFGTVPGATDLGVFNVGSATELTVPSITRGGEFVEDETLHVTLLSVYGQDHGQCPSLVSRMLTVDAFSTFHTPNPTFDVTPSNTSKHTVGRELTFDASGTTDLEDDTDDLKYKWRFGENEKWTKWKRGRTVIQHTFKKVGDKLVSVKVKDSTRLKARYDMELDIDPNQDPQARFKVDFDGDDRGPFPGDQVKLDASSSYDNETQKSILQVRWKGGDRCGWSNWSTNKTKKVKYKWAGSKQVKLEVRDTNGNVDSYTGYVHIQERPYCHHVYGRFSNRHRPNRERDRSRSTCRPPAWCDVQCQSMRQAICSYDNKGYLRTHNGVILNVAGMCLNTAEPPEEFGYHFDWADDLADVIGVNNLEINHIMGLTRNELLALGYSNNKADWILSGKALREAGRQRPTLTAQQWIKMAKAGTQSVCDTGACVKFHFGAGLFDPDIMDADDNGSWNDGIGALRGEVQDRGHIDDPVFFGVEGSGFLDFIDLGDLANFTKEVLLDYYGDVFDDLVRDVKCWVGLKSCGSNNSSPVEEGCL